MKHLFFILFTLPMFGSSQTKPLTSPLSTEYSFPNIKVNEPFYLDTLSIFDSLYMAHFDALYLQHRTDSVFNEFAKNEIYKTVEFEKQYLDVPDEENDDAMYSFVLQPIEVFITDSIISVCNVIDTYSKGGNHHNYMYYSYSYSRIKHAPIIFSNVFNLQTPEDSEEFRTFIEGFKTEGSCDNWGGPMLYIDFSFTKNGIMINPNLSWACFQSRACIPYKTNHKFVHKDGY